MTRLVHPSTAVIRLVTEIGEIAAAAGSPEERAQALLQPLRRLIPFEGASVAVSHPERPFFHPLAARGYTDAILDYLRGPDLSEDIERVGLHRQRTPMRLRDMPVHPDEIPAWRERFAPAGFREGLSACLYRPDGSQVGLVTLHTDSVRHPTDEARDLLGTLTPVIANAVDPMRSVTALARMVSGAQGGVVLAGSGNPLPLPGFDPHPLLAAGSPVLDAAVAALVDPQVHATFLCAEPHRGHARITVLACPNQAPRHLRAIVLVSPPGNVRELTRRELEVLGLLVDGWSNQRMAATLFISERTVAAHIEHILSKLCAPSRTLAAVRALRLGLYVPRSLQGLRSPADRADGRAGGRTRMEGEDA